MEGREGSDGVVRSERGREGSGRGLEGQRFVER